MVPKFITLVVVIALLAFSDYLRGFRISFYDLVVLIRIRTGGIRGPRIRLVISRVLRNSICARS